MRLIGLAVILAIYLLATPLVAEAQAGKVYTVGILSVGFLEQESPDWWKPFVDAMRELNYVEGRNLRVNRAAAQTLLLRADPVIE